LYTQVLHSISIDTTQQQRYFRLHISYCSTKSGHSSTSDNFYMTCLVGNRVATERPNSYTVVQQFVIQRCNRKWREKQNKLHCSS